MTIWRRCLTRSGSSRAAFRTIRQNLAWAFGYNAAAIPLAALGYLNPILAAAAMTLFSVFVVPRTASGCSATTAKGNPMTTTTYLVTG